jgi:hypothetical protein
MDFFLSIDSRSFAELHDVGDACLRTPITFVCMDPITLRYDWFADVSRSQMTLSVDISDDYTSMA